VTDRRPRSNVSSRILAEVFVVWLNDDRLELAGTRGAEPWLIDVRPTDDPVELVDGSVRAVLGPPRLVHSTSWRREPEALILSFVVVVDDPRVGGLHSGVIRRSKLARSQATRAPSEISRDQVLEHGLRHLAWLASDDPVVSSRLPERWHNALSTYLRHARGTRGRPSARWGSLTPTEIEIVHLVADGLNNPEIGSRLYMSRGNVKTHLSHVFAKLGISNRTELATLATARLSSRWGSADGTGPLARAEGVARPRPHGNEAE
jgi:DNA-binding CsgD family transcriptional regulator